MEKVKIIEQAYRLTMMEEPKEDILRLLEGEELERVFEVLLILRGWPNVRNPAGFLKRAIQEGWTPETKPQKVDRRLENYEERYYLRRGYTPEQAREMVIRGRS